MFRIFLDGFYIFYSNLEAILAFFLAAFGFGLVVVSSDHGIHGRIERWLLCLGVGPILLALTTFLLAILSQIQTNIFSLLSFLIFILSTAVVLYGLWRETRELRAFNPLALLVSLGLVVILTLRLAFLRYILLPPYTDSPIHYQIIQQLLAPGNGEGSMFSIQNLVGDYYHYGFHSMAAWLASVSGTSSLVIMPLLGQVFLVISVVSIMAFVQAATGKWTASLMAGLFAGIGWSMPAYAANWGKYPAIFALVVFPAYMAIIKYFLTSEHPRRKIPWVIALTFGIGLIHTRILVLILLAGMSFMLIQKYAKSTELTLAQGTRIAFLYGITLTPLYVILANFYRDIPILLLLVLVSPFAFHYYPRISIGIFFFSFFVELIGLFQRLFPEVLPTLLNEEFIEMCLYIPLSILGGLGMDGVVQRLKGKSLLRWVIPSAAIGLMAFHLVTGITLVPDPCCNLYTEDDQEAFRWIQQMVSENGLVITSAYQEDNQFFGTDAGIWLFPLIGVRTNKLPYDITWSATDEIQQTCLSGAREIYIYGGGREFSFDKTQLNQAEWADPGFSSGNTVIYKVNPC